MGKKATRKSGPVVRGGRAVMRFFRLVSAIAGDFVRTFGLPLGIYLAWRGIAQTDMGSLGAGVAIFAAYIARPDR